jgi:hypothetical protein
LQCANCGHLNEDGKFCVKCGSKLGEEGISQQVAATAENHPYQQSSTVSSQPNQHVENVKQISTMYASYFWQGIKNPTTTAKGAGENQFINALITIILYSVSVPLMIYIGWKIIIYKLFMTVYDAVGAHSLFGEIAEGASPNDIPDIEEFTFVDIVLKQSIFFLIGVLVIIAASYGIIKLAKVDVSFKAFIARFGTYMIVPTTVFLVGIVLCLIHIDLFLYCLLFGLLGMFFVIPVTLLSFKRNSNSGLDTIYGILILYVVTVIVYVMIAKGLGTEIQSIITDASDTDSSW